MPDGSVTSSDARLANASVVMIASAEARRRRRRAAAARPREPGRDALGVERDADDAGRGDRDLVGSTPGRLAAAPCIASATSHARLAGRGVRVAGVRDDDAQRVGARRASRVTSTGAASTPERVKRAALTVSGRVADEQADVERRPRP